MVGFQPAVLPVNEPPLVHELRPKLRGKHPVGAWTSPPAPRTATPAPLQIQKVTHHTDLAALARYVDQLQAETGDALSVDELLDDEFLVSDPAIA